MGEQNSKNIMTIVITVIITALVVGIGAYAYFNSTRKSSVTNPSNLKLPTTEEMKQLPPANEGEEKLPFTKTNEDNDFVYYKGNILISGEYNETKPDTIFGGMLCFYPDEDEISKLPGNPLFCFENQEKAKKGLGINDSDIFKDPKIECIKGRAVIEISNYKVNKKEAAVRNTAKFEESWETETRSTDCKLTD